jgi:hypothetical protein
MFIGSIFYQLKCFSRLQKLRHRVLSQFLRQRRKNLLSVLCTFSFENFLIDPFANAPVKRGQSGIYGASNTCRVPSIIWRRSYRRGSAVASGTCFVFSRSRLAINSGHTASSAKRVWGSDLARSPFGFIWHTGRTMRIVNYRPSPNRTRGAQKNG